MPVGRPEIPAELKRAVLVEAGHRCAIPTCRQTPVELAHITPWAKVKEHTFDNLIALCPTCHTRFDRGDIDRKAMFQYKANLDILNYRYTDLERQLLRAFIRRWQNARQALGQPQQAAGATRPQQIELSDMAQLAGVGRIRIYEPMTWAFTNLLDDGLIEFRDVSHFRTLLDQESTMVSRPVELTAKGCDFVVHWAAAQPLE
ncbi:HNH endonuclease [Nocardia niigatensis]